MAKRFTDTSKWDDEWFMNLSPEKKMAYMYILDKCDSVGVWKANFKLANFQVGCDINWDSFLQNDLKDRVYKTNSGDWFLPDFIRFQYGELTEESTSKPIQSYIKQLKNHSLWILYTKGIDTLKEKEKEKEKDIDGSEKKSFYRKFAHLSITDEEVDKLISEGYTKHQIDDMLDKIENYKGNKNYKSLILTVRNWLKKEMKDNEPQIDLSEIKRSLISNGYRNQVESKESFLSFKESVKNNPMYDLAVKKLEMIHGE